MYIPDIEIPAGPWPILLNSRSWNKFTFILVKVQVFWKGHKIWKKISHLFWRYWVKIAVSSKQVGNFFKFCGLLTMSWLYQFHPIYFPKMIINMKKNMPIVISTKLIILFDYEMRVIPWNPVLSYILPLF